MILVTICARAGSKRLPGKHMREFCGEPLITWTGYQAVDWASKNGAFVVMSTDFMKDTVPYLGSKSECITQPDWCAKDDKNPKLNAIRDALEQAGGLFETQFETIIDLDATNPCRKVEHIEEAYQLYKNSRLISEGKKDYKQVPSLVSIVPARRMPTFNMVRKHPDGYLFMGDIKSCSPDWPLYDLNASIYIYSREFLINPDNTHPVTFGTVGYEMPGWTTLDIDHEWEFVAAEALFRRYVLDGS